MCPSVCCRHRRHHHHHHHVLAAANPGPTPVEGMIWVSSWLDKISRAQQLSLFFRVPSHTVQNLVIN